MEAGVAEFLDAVFPVMLYPDTTDHRAGEFTDAIFAGSDPGLRARWQADPAGREMMLASYLLAIKTGKSPDDRLRDLHARTSSGNMAGFILAALVEMDRCGIPPSVNLAVKLAIKEEHRGDRWIRDSWSRFKPVSPLWLAWSLFLRNMRDDEIATSMPQDMREARYFLGWARHLFDFAATLRGIGFEASVRAVVGCDLWASYTSMHPFGHGFATGPMLADIDRDLLVALHRKTGRPTTKK